ncbi:MAG: CRISPR-associated helicase Cas3' [Thermoguttaceae bacterium]|nr:CRISPR-associated helicase Cas3' [Thermoguttaceae bacterium]
MSPRFTPSQGSLPVPLSLDHCFAKQSPDGQPRVPIEEHLCLVGNVAQKLLARMPTPLRRLWPEGVVTLAAVHDVGKISPGFQRKIWPADQLKKVCPELVTQDGFSDDHSEIGESALRDYFRRHSGPEAWATTIGLHHGGYRKPLPHNSGVYGGPQWAELRLQTIDRMVERFGPLPQTPPPDSFTAVTGLVCVADWLASGEEFFPYDQPLACHLKNVDHVLDRVGFYWPKPRPSLSFEDIFGFAPHDIQACTYQLADRPGLILVEAPMGAGKTEAALWAAYRLMLEGHNHGLYFALPTRIASNLVHKRVGQFLEKVFGPQTAARLLHGSAWLYRFLDDPQLRDMFGGGEEFRPGFSWFAPAKRGILWPFGVGTVDQALLAVLCVKHFFMRLFGLAGKVVILDEIHTYDMYTGTLIDSLIAYLRELGCTIILLSGTLTQSRRESLGISVPASHAHAYPLVSTSDNRCLTPAAPSITHKTVYLETKDPADDHFWDELFRVLREGAAVIWLCNTVAQSQQVYSEVVSRLTVDGVAHGLLHSLMLPKHRHHLELQWTQRLGKTNANRGPAILIATQVVEQSVDLDADLMITSLAPMDILLQRLGRLWRHPRPWRPVPVAQCWLIDHECLSAQTCKEFLTRLGASTRVYAPYLLWRTAKTLHALNSITMPDGIRALLEQTYVDPQPDDPPWVNQLYEECQKHSQELRNTGLMLQSHHIPTLKDDESVATRYSDIPREPVLILRSATNCGSYWKIQLISEADPLLWDCQQPSMEAVAKLHLNTLEVPSWLLKDIPWEAQPPFVQQAVGKGARVLLWEPSGKLHTITRTPTPLWYSLTLGFYRQTDSGSLEDENFQLD